MDSQDASKHRGNGTCLLKTDSPFSFNSKNFGGVAEMLGG